jgi:hypothetical protein
MHARYCHIGVPHTVQSICPFCTGMPSACLVLASRVCILLPPTCTCLTRLPCPASLFCPQREGGCPEGLLRPPEERLRRLQGRPEASGLLSTPPAAAGCRGVAGSWCGRWPYLLSSAPGLVACCVWAVCMLSGWLAICGHASTCKHKHLVLCVSCDTVLDAFTHLRGSGGKQLLN